MTRARLLFFAVLLGLAVPARAFAQEEDKPPRRPRLEYTRGPSACTHEEDFETEIYLITHLEPTTDSPDVVRVWCSRGPMGFTCRVQYINAAGEPGKIERIDGWDCWRVAREAAVAASEHMPKATCPKPAPCPAPEPCPSCPAPAPCRCPPQRVCPLPPKPEKTWYRMSDLSLYAMGLLTGGLWADPGGAIAAGVEVRGELAEKPWVPAPSLALELRFAFPGRAEVALPFDPTKPTVPAPDVTLSQFTAALVPCARWKYFFGCALIQGGFYYLESATDQTQASLAIGPRLGVRLPITDQFGLFGFGEALFAPIRPGFMPSNGGQNAMWRPSVAQGFGGLGVEVVFP